MSKGDHSPRAIDVESSPPSKRRMFRSISASSSDFVSVDASSPSLSPFSHNSDGWSPSLSPARGVEVMPDLPAVPEAEPAAPSGISDWTNRSGMGSNDKRIASRVNWPAARGINLEQAFTSSTRETPSERDAHVMRLQAQLANVSDYLSGLVSNTSGQPSDSLMFRPTILRTHDRPKKPLDPHINTGSTREAELERENEQLKKALRIQSEILARRRLKKEHGRAFEPPPVTVPRGIDPQAVSELANDLICGIKTVNDAASTLLDLVDRAGGTTVEREREKMHPLVRLNNAEGVLDITMDRVTALEKDTKSLKRSAEWEIYQRCEASCRDY